MATSVLKIDLRPRATRNDIVRMFLPSAVKTMGVPITVHLLTGLEGKRRKRDTRQAVIADVQINGMLLKVFSKDGGHNYWTSFVSWVELWTGDVRVLGGPLQEIQQLYGQEDDLDG